VNHELGSWEEVVVAYSRYYGVISVEGLRKTTELRNKQCCGPDWNGNLPSKTRAFLIHRCITMSETCAVQCDSVAVEDSDNRFRTKPKNSQELRIRDEMKILCMKKQTVDRK
jgi:hypothetical protein